MRDRYTQDCVIDGCCLAQYRGGLCRKHWEKVPRDWKLALMADVMQQAHELARVNHAEWARYVQAKELEEARRAAAA